ncbi:uncharacterized protein Smp_201570 [Schistosoma mansoni]|uniref:uncharacterized protein n=1 Tax=Schistosoma mansoni TaxID=6183 RepID=UPI00022DC555|nr:uncharacterized protein Smp_201570 [Schistosoma mansoni]|eukprot:XP_018650264.1 uncharacterized protein Smp_201570 [Schistosoma mansoni]
MFIYFKSNNLTSVLRFYSSLIDLSWCTTGELFRLRIKLISSGHPQSHQSSNLGPKDLPTNTYPLEPIGRGLVVQFQL